MLLMMLKQAKDNRQLLTANISNSFNLQFVAVSFTKVQKLYTVTLGISGQTAPHGTQPQNVFMRLCQFLPG